MMTHMRGIERRLSALEGGSVAAQPTAADIAATALWMFEQAGMASPDTAGLEQQARGGEPRTAALRLAAGFVSEDALRVLSEVAA